jgi:hypothetical protein
VFSIGHELTGKTAVPANSHRPTPENQPIGSEGRVFRRDDHDEERVKGRDLLHHATENLLRGNAALRTCAVPHAKGAVGQRTFRASGARGSIAGRQVGHSGAVPARLEAALSCINKQVRSPRDIQWGWSPRGRKSAGNPAMSRLQVNGKAGRSRVWTARKTFRTLGLRHPCGDYVAIVAFPKDFPG